MSDENSLAGISFRRGCQAGPSAEGWPCVQLWNPPDSGVNGFLTCSWTYQSHNTIAWSVRLKEYWPPLLNPENAQDRLAGVCMYLGKPDGKIEVRYYCISPNQENEFGREIEQQERGQGWMNGTEPTVFADPLILPPGTGVLWMARAAGILLRASFAWREKLVQ